MKLTHSMMQHLFGPSALLFRSRAYSAYFLWGKTKLELSFKNSAL